MINDNPTTEDELIAARRRESSRIELLTSQAVKIRQLEVLCRQLAEAGQKILPRFIELRHYREKREGTSFAQDFQEAEDKLKSALEAAKKAGVIE
jgi:hypothetical protein